VSAFDLSLREAAAALRARTVSPVELTAASLERIEKVDGRVKAFARVTADEAHAAARAAEKRFATGACRGPLDGIPVGVKDIFDTEGVETSAGSRVLAGRLPTKDARVVAQLRDAGAIVLGKLRTHEFAYGLVTPPTRNPWDLERIPGGSSGGSAASVAAGECLLATGSDTAGSIRIPSSLCGVVGLKPTVGSWSTDGMIPLAWSLDHAGPIALHVSDIAVSMSVLARGPTRAYVDSLDKGVEGLVLGVPVNYFFDDLQPDVDRAVRQAIADLDALGATVRDIELPHAEHGVAIAFEICLVEAASYHADLYAAHSDLYGEDVRLYVEVGATRPGIEYVRALRARERLRRMWLEAMAGVDVLIAPTLPATAARADHPTVSLPSGETDIVSAYLRFCAPLNVTGFPALSLPCGFDASGLPIGLQIIGRPTEDARVLRVGHAYESATGWHSLRPEM
jgi:aspartyl-tRNA(Asn)/glutamyl-tRNA(Gln) amidotransferase subunit A